MEAEKSKEKSMSRSWHPKAQLLSNPCAVVLEMINWMQKLYFHENI